MSDAAYDPRLSELQRMHARCEALERTNADLVQCLYKAMTAQPFVRVHLDPEYDREKFKEMINHITDTTARALVNELGYLTNNRAELYEELARHKLAQSPFYGRY